MSAWVADLVAGRGPEIWLRTLEHLMLTGASTVAAVAVGVPLGIVAFHRPRLRSGLLSFVGILQTIPSLAMLALLLVAFGRIGVAPALAALTLYALLPVVRNTVVGLDGVDPDVGEAARGLGMTPRQELIRVRLPLALPVLAAGVRTAAVIGVGIATLSAFIGAGGLGQFINRGLALSDTGLILLGAVPAGVLALLVDGSIAGVEWASDDRRHRHARGGPRRALRLATAALPVVLLVLPAWALLADDGGAVETGSVAICTKNFTEQLLLGEIMAQSIERGTDLAVERRFNMGGTIICHRALVAGEVDVYAEYTGTALTAILDEELGDTVDGAGAGETAGVEEAAGAGAASGAGAATGAEGATGAGAASGSGEATGAGAAAGDPERVLARVDARYRERFGARWMSPFGFDNTYVLLARPELAASLPEARVSALAGRADALSVGFTAEFAERPDGYAGFTDHYGFSFGSARDLDPGILYRAVADGEVDLVFGFATDGRIDTHDLVVLEDDRSFFPPYEAAPVARVRVLEAYPELGPVLESLAGALPDSTMRRLNRQADAGEASVAELAERFLQGLEGGGT